MTFDSWYEPGGTGSGDGSGVEYTAGYRAFLEKYMRDHDVESVLDVGCGDWQFSKLVDWGNRLYVGYEVVDQLVRRLNDENVSTLRYFTNTMPGMMTRFDLIIIKDVMIDLPNDEITSMMLTLPKASHFLLVNDYAPPPNADCARGGYRALDLTAPPFGLRGEIVYRFPRIHNADKVVFECAS